MTDPQNLATQQVQEQPRGRGRPRKEGIPSDGFDSEESEAEPEIEESNLPTVALRNTGGESQEEYLLTRLRAAKARVETEQIRMQYFEATGRMPPDSESEDE
jgi:hypothetical protein